MDYKTTNKSKPVHYYILFDMSKDSYKGIVEITMETHKNDNRDYLEIDEVELNSNNLNIKKVYGKNENDVTNIASTFTSENDILKIKFGTPVTGKFITVVVFENVIEEVLDGFYRSKYNNDYLFATHFEPTSACKAFPCVDQPDMKATFKLEITVPRGDYIALSNMRAEKCIKKISGVYTYIFETTPVMSTYLMAIVVGRLDYIESTDHRVPIRVYAHPDEKEWGRFALNVASKCLKFYEEYFGIDYPLPKLDMVGFPAFAAGAMENWGLVTYRKTALLIDPEKATTAQKLRVAEVVCHELAHMWFGNLVTMKWFNELWLNEGFATWASHLAMFAIKDELLGGLNIWNHFINDNIERGMQFDSLKSTHKIACVVNNPDEIETIFDEISYSKGSSIIRMLEKWITPQCFQEGLRIYLNKFSYSNAESNDLWDCLDQAFKGEDKVGDVMNPWIEREGFPYIKVEENGSSIVFKQERFTVGYDAVNEDPWPIPINVKWLDTDVIETYLMKEKTLEIPKYDSSSREEKGRFYKLNIEGSGFYRVFYSDHHFKELFKFKNSLNAKDLLNLVNDLWAFSYNDSIRFPIFLNEILRFEDDYNVLYSTLINFFKLISLFYDDKNKRSVLYEKINYIVGDKLKNFTLSNENCEKLSLNERLKMALFIEAGIVTESYEVKDKNIPFEFRKFFFKSQKDAEFEAIYDFYQTSTTPGLKEAALVGLTSTKDKDNFKKLCNVTVIPPHDSIYLFSGLASNINFRNEIMSYFVFNYSVIKNHVKEGNLLRAAVKYVLGNSLDESLEGPIKDFFKSHAEDSDIKSAVDYASRKYEINKSLRNKYKSRSLD